MWRLTFKHRRKFREYALSSFEAVLQVILELEGYDPDKEAGKLDDFDILDPRTVSDGPMQYGHIAHTGAETKTRYVMKLLRN